MQKAMVLADSGEIRELKETAKWGMDKEKKSAILELARYGNEGFSAIQEVLDLTVYPDIRQACIEAIKSAHKTRAKEKQERSIRGPRRSRRKAIKNKKTKKGKSRRG